MREERELASKSGLESPVWESIEDTHSCYNDCLSMALENVKENSLIFVACHNVDSINIAK